MNVVELFSGSGTLSKEFRDAGHNVFSIDIRKRKGICEPDLKKNILHLLRKEIPFEKVDVVWASPPCDVFSKASGGFHWTAEGLPKTEKCMLHIQILKKSLALIQKLNPTIFFIENPDGKMKYRNELVSFLIKNEGMTKKLFYSNYGFPLPKPTNLFTNALDFKPRKNSLDTFAKSSAVIFDNLTKCQRQAIPRELAKHILEYCESKIKPGSFN
jgi:site-specific DNA-cytosine methylase